MHGGRRVFKLIDPKQAEDDGHMSGVDEDPKGCYVDVKLGKVMFNKGATNKGRRTKSASARSATAAEPRSRSISAKASAR